MKDFIRQALETIRRIVTHPTEELGRWQRAVRWLYDFCRYGWKQLYEDGASSMASALSYCTLFGLLPVLVLATLMAKAFIGDRLPEVVDWIVQLLGIDDVRFGEGEGVTLSSWIEGLVAQASNFKVATLGWLGGLVLIYSAINLMVTIENSFNKIVRAPSGRPWVKRIPLYWFVLTIGPILLGLTPYLDAKYAQFMGNVSSFQWALVILKYGWTLALFWGFMCALYLWVPNTSLRLRPVAIGALVAALLLTGGKGLLIVYVRNAFGDNKLLGSLGFVPLFMLWVYVMWMCVLFGLEVAAMVQYLKGRRMEELEKKRPKNELVDPAGVLLLMQVVGARFRDGAPTTTAQIVEATGMPPNAIEKMVGILVERRILHRIDGPGTSSLGVALARPPETISAQELMTVGWELVDGAMKRSGESIIDQLREAQRRLAEGTTLEGMMPPARAPLPT